MIPVLEMKRGLVSGATHELVVAGRLSFSVNAGFSDHVIDGKVLLPGLGFVELAFVVRKRNRSSTVLSGVDYLRPCSL